MLSNLLKNINKKFNRFITISSNRCLTSQKEYHQTADQEEEAALKIEANLFDNSSIKYEPIKKTQVFKNSKQIVSKKDVNINLISKPTQFPSFKKSRLEREAESKIIHDQDLGIDFVKLSNNDPRLNKLLTTIRSKKRRDKDKQIVIEGRRLILEALMCGLKLNSVIFSNKERLADIKEVVSRTQKQFNTKIYKVAHHDLKSWSILTSPPGVMAIFERPVFENMPGTNISSSKSLPITVVCDNLREPNNLGSIIRVCAAIPCQQIVITRGCCDPWESKVLRGGCGGHFRLPIRDDVEWDEVPLAIPPEVADNCYVFVAENKVENLRNKIAIADYSEVGSTGLHNVVIIGGESHGVSPEAYRLMESVGQRGKCLYIPLAEGIDSLNVTSALTLILYELRKTILKSKISNN